MGTVRQIRGKWAIDYRDQLGRRHREVAGNGTSVRAAERLLRKRESEIETGTFSIDGRRRAFGEYARAWIKGIRPTVKRSTWDSYNGHVKHHLLDPKLGLVDRKLSSFTRPLVLEFRAALIETRPKRSPHTINRIMARLSQILESAVLDGLIPSNPMRRIGQLPVPQREMDFLTAAELQKALRAARGVSEDLYLGVLLSALTGIRLGELRALRRKHLDLARSRLLVRESYGRGAFTSPKNRHHREVKLSPHLVHELRAWLLLRGNPDGEALLFPMAPGKAQPVGDQFFWDGWKRALKAAGLRQTLRWHDLRHTYASLMLAQGVSMKWVSEQLGHSSIQITLDRYTHLLPDAGEHELELLDEALFGAPAEGAEKAGS